NVSARPLSGVPGIFRFIKTQVHILPIKVAVRKMVQPVAQVDISAVFIQSNIQRQMPVSENKIIVMGHFKGLTAKMNQPLPVLAEKDMLFRGAAAFPA